MEYLKNKKKLIYTLALAVLAGTVTIMAYFSHLNKSIVVDNSISEASDPVAEFDSLAETAPATLGVHIKGEVQNPGFYTLPPGKRVGDAIKAAGGVTEHGDIESVNLAEFLGDGKEYIVLRKNSFETSNANESKGTSGSSGSTGSTRASGTSSSSGSTRATGTSSSSGSTRASGTSGSSGAEAIININTANEATLVQLPGIGSARAKAIISYRERNNGFKTINELSKVKGITVKMIESFKDRITI